MNTKKAYLLLAAAVLLLQAIGVAQKQEALFSSVSPLDIKLSFSIKEVAKSKKDSIYLPNQLYFRKASGEFDSIKIALKSRGNFRLQECYFPPLWVKTFIRGDKNNLFSGNRKLKLVLPCRTGSLYNTLILREYLCYKMYEHISPYAFKTRLVNIDFTEIRNRHPKQFDLKGILVEDLDHTAKRFKAEGREELKLAPLSLQDTGSVRFSLFQYMISNTDLSTAYQHNTKLMQLQNGSFISVPYDFDMSGIVNAPYAVVSTVNGVQLDVQSVRDRIYRGWCRSPEVTEFVRQEFIAKKALILAEVDHLNEQLTEREIQDIKDYLEDFFRIIGSDELFKKNITDICRKPE